MTTKKMTPRDLQKYGGRLTFVYETMYPVKFRLTKALGDVADNAGDCRVVEPRNKDRGKYFEVRVHPDLCFMGALLTLSHEYAHAMAWRPDRQEEHREQDHDAEFGIAWAKAWTILGL